MEQRLNESLGRYEFNGTLVDVIKSYLDLSRSAQSKKDSIFRCIVFTFSLITFEQKKKKDSGFIYAPSCFSLRDAPKHTFLSSEGQAENLISGQSNTMIVT